MASATALICCAAETFIPSRIAGSAATISSENREGTSSTWTTTIESPKRRAKPVASLRAGAAGAEKSVA
jgi:hypothetical protein